MSDLAFYNVGCESRGLKRAVVPLRRLLRRVLRPIFLRQVEILQEICNRLDGLEAGAPGGLKESRFKNMRNPL